MNHLLTLARDAGVGLRAEFRHNGRNRMMFVTYRLGGFRQVGVTALGSDSTTKLYAGFTSIPVERKWIDAAIRALRAD